MVATIVFIVKVSRDVRSLRGEGSDARRDSPAQHWRLRVEYGRVTDGLRCPVSASSPSLKHSEAIKDRV